MAIPVPAVPLKEVRMTYYTLTPEEKLIIDAIRRNPGIKPLLYRLLEQFG